MNAFFGILLIMFALAIIVVAKNSQDVKEQNLAKKKICEKYNAPVNLRYNYYCISAAELLKNDEPYCMWTDDGKIKFLQEYVDSYLEISIHAINFFQAKGEAGYITEVSGGGGGGSSVGGAIVGGMIAGPTGAIIGSRKKNEAVTSTARYVDDRKTVLSFMKDGNEKILVFDKGKLYDELLIICPEKDYEIVKLRSQSNEN